MEHALHHLYSAIIHTAYRLLYIFETHTRVYTQAKRCFATQAACGSCVRVDQELVLIIRANLLY